MKFYLAVALGGAIGSVLRFGVGLAVARHNHGGFPLGVLPVNVELDTMEALQAHHYTGNVRELINILQRAMTMSDGKQISADDLMLEHVEVAAGPSDTPAAQAEPTKADDESLDDYIENIEKKMLEDALKKAKYNKTRAAEMLGISFRSFRYKLKKFDID